MALLTRDTRIVTMTLRDGAPTAGALNALVMTNAGSYFTESLDIGTFTEGMAFLYTTAHGGTNPTLDVKFQGSSDQKHWADLGDAFTQITTSGDGVAFIKRLSTNFGKYIRAMIVIGGTASPTYTTTLQLAMKG